MSQMTWKALLRRHVINNLRKMDEVIFSITSQKKQSSVRMRVFLRKLVEKLVIQMRKSLFVAA